MKLQVFLAILLLTVVAFAEADMTNIGASGTSETTVTTTTDGSESMTEEPTTVTAVAAEPVPVLISSERRFGSCSISTETSAGDTRVKAVCEVTLPTPCHEVGYGWIPGVDTNQYVFSVWIKQMPGICVEMLETRRIASSAVFSGENLGFRYKIQYTPFSGTVEEASTSEPTGQSEWETVSASNCEQVRQELRIMLNDLEMRKKLASSAGRQEEYNQLLEEWKQIREKLENLNCEGQVEQVIEVFSATAMCVQERLQLEERLERLYLALREADEEGVSEKARIIEEEIRAFKQRLEELPTIERCEALAQATAVGETTMDILRDSYTDYFEKIKEVDLKIRLLDPCVKVELLEKRIANLKEGIETADSDEVEAIEAKIGALVEVRDILSKACEHLKDNPACVGLVGMRNEFKEYLGAVRSGEKELSVTKTQAVDWFNRFMNLERTCLTDVKMLFDEHPCIASQVLEFELDSLTAEGESEIIGELYSRMKEYEMACVRNRNIAEFREQARETIEEGRTLQVGTASEHAGDIARLVGELELKKHIILADDTLSQEEKNVAVVQIEAEKASMIREVIASFKQARVSSSTKLSLAPDKLEVEGEQVDNEDVVLEVPTTDEGMLEVEVKDDKIELRTERARITARIALDLENGILKVRGKAIKLPEEVMGAIDAEIGELELKEEGDEPVYEGTVEKEFRLLAILPIRGSVFVKADATEGDVIEMRRPWWTIFATE